MSRLALINELIGMPPNASEHGYQIDHIIEFSHWFMAALFVGWSAFFVYVLLRFRKRHARHQQRCSGEKLAPMDSWESHRGPVMRVMRQREESSSTGMLYGFRCDGQNACL